eukprot:1068090-Rhodomonas_salina.2
MAGFYSQHGWMPSPVAGKSSFSAEGMHYGETQNTYETTFRASLEGQVDRLLDSEKKMLAHQVARPLTSHALAVRCRILTPPMLLPGENRHGAKGRGDGETEESAGLSEVSVCWRCALGEWQQSYPRDQDLEDAERSRCLPCTDTGSALRVHACQSSASGTTAMTYRDLAFGAFRQEVAGIDTVRAENDILRNSLAETTAQLQRDRTQLADTELRLSQVPSAAAKSKTANQLFRTDCTGCAVACI